MLLVSPLTYVINMTDIDDNGTKREGGGGEVGIIGGG